MQLPTGTVTFLFTDIEGSTKLWERAPEQMRMALARHDATMRDAIEGHGGAVFKTIGDAFCAAFATAPEALDASLAAQRALRADAPDAVHIAVRMALHTGAAEVRDGDYFGQPLNRVARLLAIGHGGQILVSQACREMLPWDAPLADKGSHRLKDLQQPEHVYEVAVPDLLGAFPPLRSLHNTNMPIQTTSFVGRGREIEDVRRLPSTSRLLTLTGAGGCGKTRLALQVAAEALDAFPDGVWLVELAALTDPALVPQTVATVLGLCESPRQPLMDTLVSFLQPRSLALILDNCEHLVEACAVFATAILRSCPRVRILATSREPLNVAGEHRWRVPPLLAPEHAGLAPAQASSVAVLMGYDAPRLFVERATEHRHDFVLTRRDAPAVAHLCRRLDGLPLAIELAAARLRSLSVEEINSRLDNRFRLLTGGARTVLPRQQTLRALMDWSYDLLDERERSLLRRLSVFAGGWTLRAAEQVGSGQGIEEEEVLDLLTSLVDKSLVVAEAEEQETRYRLLETVRQYAHDRLAETTEIESVRERHQGFFVALAEEADPHLRGPEQATWLHRLEREQDNLRAALEECGQEASLQIAGVISWLWYVRGHLSEGRDQMARVLARPDAQGRTSARGRALQGAGVLAYAQGDYTEARRLHTESLALRRELGDKPSIAGSLNSLGVLAYEQGDFRAASALLSEGLALRRGLGDRQGVAASLNNLGLVAQAQDDYPTARALQEESLRILRDVGDRSGLAHALFNLGNVALAQCDYAGARRLFEESLALRRELGDRVGVAYSLLSLGCVAQAQGDNAAARSIQSEGLSVFREIGDKRGMAFSLHNMGVAAHDDGDHGAAHPLLQEGLVLFHELDQKQGIATSLRVLASLAAAQGGRDQAVPLWAAAEALREEIGAPLPPSDRDQYELELGAARQALGDERFAAAWAAGRAMTMQQAVELALAASNRLAA